MTIKLQSGTAEKDGIELAPRNVYTFSNVRTKITTWHGCELEVEGATSEESVAQYATLAENPGNALLNLHDKLNGLRDAAGREGREGPRILVTGEGSSGKTVVARTLTGYATRQGYQPLVVNTDPAEGMLTLPGCLSASVCATILDPEAVDGWGATPTSGPSNVPVKLPLVQYYGRRTPEEDPEAYKGVVSRLAGSVSGRLSEDLEVRQSGVIIDGTSVGEKDEGVDMLAHVVDEFSGKSVLSSTKCRLTSAVNVVVVIGTTRVNDEIARRFADEKTSLGEPVAVIFLDKSDGAVERSPALAEHARQAVIKEYFFGDSRRTLSPQIQQVDFSGLTLYKVPDCRSSPALAFGLFITRNRKGARTNSV